MNDFAFNPINSNSEERTSSTSDYSTPATPEETRYQEDTPTITPEVVDDEVVAAEILDDIDDINLVETNPVAGLAADFQGELAERALKPDETNYTEDEARRVTEELKVKLLHALEAQYDFIQAAEKAFDGHIWVALGYPEGMKGWTMYCADNFAAEKIRLTGQQRTDLITGFTPGKISNRGIAALLGVSDMTVGRAKAKAEIAPSMGKVRDSRGRMHTIDTGSMSSKDRQKRIVELAEQGMKQNDIAKEVGVGQSTVSDTLRKEKIRRWSEGLDPAASDEDPDATDDDQPLAIDMGDMDDKARSYIEAFDAMAKEASGALESLVEKLESDYWRPGSATVDEIIVRDADTIFTVMDLMGKFLRLLNIDAETVFGDMEDEHGKWARFIDGCDELGTVCEEIVD